MRKLGLIIGLLGALSASAEESVATPRYRERGLAAAACFGVQCAGLGAQALYFMPIGSVDGRAMNLSFSLGAGVDLFKASTLGVAGGISGILGSQHRVVLDVGYGTVTVPLFLHGTRAAWVPMSGPHVAFGYEMVAEYGLLIRILGGASIPLDARLDATGRYLNLELGTSVGWKF
jgi:hypothetical protein